MYRVDTDGVAAEQIRALPPDGLTACAELRAVLENDPWSGRPFHREKPGTPLRSLTFGAFGLAFYLVLDDRHRVDVLTVQWAG